MSCYTHSKRLVLLLGVLGVGLSSAPSKEAPWGGGERRLSATSGRLLQQPEVKTSGSLQNTTFIVRINHKHGTIVANRYLEVWSDALQKYGISHIVFYGCNLKIEHMRKTFGGLNVHICENDDDVGGFFWYHLKCSNTTTGYTTTGYMFAHDDATLDLKSLSESMDSNQSWFTLAQQPIVPLDITNEIQPIVPLGITNEILASLLVKNDGWHWVNTPWGVPAILNALDDPDFSAKYRASLWTCTQDSGSIHFRGRSDVFFISSRQYPVFKEAASLFAKHEVFLEIALPTIAYCILGEFQSMSLWQQNRQQNPDQPSGLSLPLPPGYQVYHPLKLSYQHNYDYLMQWSAPWFAPLL